MKHHGEVVSDLRRAEELATAWDELAVSASRPYCSPGWLLAWWRYAAPAHAELRMIAGWEGSELIGIAPLFASHARRRVREFRFLGSGVSTRVEPVARAGREDAMASTIAAALARARPGAALVSFEGIPEGSLWPEWIQESWPGSSSPRLRRGRIAAAPTLYLKGQSYDNWFAGKSRNFRSQMRRALRTLSESGATFKLARTRSELDEGLRAFNELHHARWHERGGSGVLSLGVERMLVDAARALSSGDRFQLWLIDLNGRPISAQIFISAGTELAYWGGGFDAAWAAQRPSLLGILAAIEHGHSLGFRSISLGAGGAPYKYRFTSDEEKLQWISLVPRRRGQLAVHGALALRQLRRRLRESASQRVSLQRRSAITSYFSCLRSYRRRS